MKPHHRELFAWLRSIGARHVRIRHHGSPHPRIAFSYGGEDFVFVVPGTPSDHRGVANQISALRRRLFPAEGRIALTALRGEIERRTIGPDGYPLRR